VLLMPSESDAPFEPFQGYDAGELTPDRLRKLAHAPKGAAVEEDDLDDILDQVPDEDHAKFQKLRQVIQEQLSGVKVYRVGDEPEKAVYIVGKTKDGKWAGLNTTVVET
jgi:histidine triad (HIT) family protein